MPQLIPDGNVTFSLPQKEASALLAELRSVPKEHVGNAIAALAFALACREPFRPDGGTRP
ncbi:hypothetical protein ACGYJ8_15360 [Sulfitobacter sp. 1A12126]|uniref:hypothetical protein n=1 Tax=Sulfitobacter sp. 1A12126 TaxID=3368591 RepID=UPI00374675E2